MERRGEERGNIPMNSMGGFTTAAPPNHPEMAVKLQLPLAPILPDRRGPGNSLLPTRRGTAIFSPTNTLDHPYLIINPRSSPPPDDDREPQSSPDPDPPSTTADDVSNSIRRNSPSPPPQPTAAVAAATGGATSSSSPSVKYRECLKNHAATMGGHVVDGCGEFMPSGEDGTPQSLRCAACDCHRNFHRKEIEGGGELHPHGFYPPAPSYSNNPQIGQITYSSMPPHQQQRRHHHKNQTIPSTTMVNFGGGGSGGGCGPAEESSSEDLSNMFQSGAVHQHRHHGQSSSSKKRFRTKFSQEQKDRMQEFAARVGWRIQKQDEQEVQQFCTEIGITKQVFKVWMHNNKQAMKRRQPD